MQISYEPHLVMETCAEIADPLCTACDGIGIRSEDYGLIRCECVDEQKLHLILEKTSMTTKTDAARECAYEQCAKSIWGRIATSFGQSPISWPPAWIEEELRQHFPPSAEDGSGSKEPCVPVSKLEEEVRRFDINWWFQKEDYDEDGEYVKWSDIEALIAEAK